MQNKNAISIDSVAKRKVAINKDSLLDLLKYYFISKDSKINIRLDLQKCINHDFYTHVDSICLSNIDEIEDFVTFIKYLNIEEGTIYFDDINIVFEHKQRYIAYLSLELLNNMLKSIVNYSMQNYLNCDISYYIKSFRRVNISFSSYFQKNLFEVFNENLTSDMGFDSNTYNLLKKCNIFEGIENFTYIDITLLSKCKKEKIQIKFFNFEN